MCITLPSQRLSEDGREENGKLSDSLNFNYSSNKVMVWKPKEVRYKDMGIYSLKEYDYLSYSDRRDADLIEKFNDNPNPGFRSPRAERLKVEMDRQLELIEPERQSIIDHFNNLNKEKKAKDIVRELMIRGKTMEEQPETLNPEKEFEKKRLTLGLKRGIKRVKRLDTKRKLSKRAALNKTKKKNTKRA